MRGYPNFDLIVYKCNEAAHQHFPRELKNAQYPSFKLDAFLQTWPNTATGFDSENVVSGQAFTDEYTTVVEMHWHYLDVNKQWIDSNDCIYGVFFGDEIAYIIINPSDEFFEDLKNRQMESQRRALGKYIDHKNNSK